MFTLCNVCKEHMQQNYLFQLSITSTGFKANTLILYEYTQRPFHKILMTSFQVHKLFLGGPFTASLGCVCSFTAEIKQINWIHKFHIYCPMAKQIKTVCINTSPGKNQQQMQIRRRSFGLSLLSQPHKIILYYLHETTNKQLIPQH